MLPKEVCHSIAVKLRELADLLEFVDFDTVAEVITDVEKVEYSVENAITLLTSLATCGFKKEVKNLITNFGYKKLSDIQQKDVAELIKEAEAIVNASK
mgnify:FL=1